LEGLLARGSHAITDWFANSIEWRGFDDPMPVDPSSVARLDGAGNTVLFVCKLESRLPIVAW
jgi:hypothetical protein